MAGTDDGDDGSDDQENWETREKAFRGISQRLAVKYFRNLGGERVDGDTDKETSEVAGDGWRATLSSRKVDVGGSLTLTEVRVHFAGDPSVLDSIVEQFSQKAMRAGG